MRDAFILALVASLMMAWPTAGQTPETAPQKAPPSGHQQPRTYNPYRAVHDVEVGKFYLKRGDLAGAIARFKDALLYKDNYAEPCLFLGEAYEKKNDPGTAIHYYQEYLKILPDAAESKKVRERIARLEEELKKDNSATKP